MREVPSGKPDPGEGSRVGRVNRGESAIKVAMGEFIIGYSLAQRLLLVVYVDRRERTRIISARQATRPERKLYEET